MDIVSLFCEIDDFFLRFEKYTAQRLPETPLKNGVAPKSASQRGDDNTRQLSGSCQIARGRIPFRAAGGTLG